MSDDPVTLHWSYNAKNMEEKLSLAADRIEKLETALQDIIDERGVCGHCGNVATGRNGGMVICDKTIFGFRGLCKWTQQKPKDIARKALEGGE